MGRIQNIKEIKMWVVKLNSKLYASIHAPTSDLDFAMKHTQAHYAEIERKGWLADYPEAVVAWVETCEV